MTCVLSSSESALRLLASIGKPSPPRYVKSLLRCRIKHRRRGARRVVFIEGRRIKYLYQECSLTKL